MDKKPSVFPTAQQISDTSKEDEKAKLAAYEAEKLQVTNEVYSTAVKPEDTPTGHVDAVTMMRERTAGQMNMRDQQGKVVHPELAENTPVKSQADMRTEEQMRLRDEQLKKNTEQIQKFQTMTNDATTRRVIQDVPEVKTNKPEHVPSSPVQQQIKTPIAMDKKESNMNQYILELSQPNYNAPFDVIPLPSQGKMYPNRKSNIRVGFLTTADENILTSPNLLQSGEFLEILINRKVLEPELRYKDLHVGDRNAIMIWLRATGYGEMYPVTLLDEKDKPFDTEINLNELKTKNLGAEPDGEGLFYFEFPLSKAKIKFKLLTCGDVDDIEKLVEADKVNGSPVNNTNTYTMERTIVEVNGSRDRHAIRDFANSMRIKDSSEFNKYIEKIDSGIVLDIEVGTPGGSSIKTFLPLNINFFWPNVKL